MAKFLYPNHRTVFLYEKTRMIVCLNLEAPFRFIFASLILVKKRTLFIFRTTGLPFYNNTRFQEWRKRMEKYERILLKTDLKKTNLWLFSSPRVTSGKKSFAAPIRRPCRSFPRHNSAKFLGMSQGLREHYCNRFCELLFSSSVFNRAFCFGWNNATNNRARAKKMCASFARKNAHWSWSLATSAIASARRNPNGVIGICSLFDFQLFRRLIRSVYNANLFLFFFA